MMKITGRFTVMVCAILLIAPSVVYSATKENLDIHTDPGGGKATCKSPRDPKEVSLQPGNGFRYVIRDAAQPITTTLTASLQDRCSPEVFTYSWYRWSDHPEVSPLKPCQGSACKAPCNTLLQDPHWMPLLRAYTDNTTPACPAMTSPATSISEAQREPWNVQGPDFYYNLVVCQVRICNLCNGKPIYFCANDVYSQTIDYQYHPTAH